LTESAILGRFWPAHRQIDPPCRPLKKAGGYSQRYLRKHLNLGIANTLIKEAYIMALTLPKLPDIPLARQTDQSGIFDRLTPELCSLGLCIKEACENQCRSVAQNIQVSMSVLAHGEQSLPQITFKVGQSKVVRVVIVPWHLVINEIVHSNDQLVINWARDAYSPISCQSAHANRSSYSDVEALYGVTPTLFLTEGRLRNYLPSLQAGEAYLFVNRFDQTFDNAHYELSAVVVKHNHQPHLLEVGLPGRSFSDAIRRMLCYLRTANC